MDLKFKIFVINLDASTERLESIGKQLLDLGLTFEKISAVRGDELNEEEKSNVYNLENNQSNYYKVLNNGEIGCYLSHIRCYEKIINDKLDCALILEDDALLTPELVDYIELLDNIPNQWDYIKLSHGRKVKKISNCVALTKELTIGNAVKLPSTATGQFVSLSGAKKLIKHAFPIARPIDVDIQYWFERNLKCLIVRPFPVLTGNFGSEINDVSDRRTSKKNPWRRLWEKCKYEYNLLIHRNNVCDVPTIKLKD